MKYNLIKNGVAMNAIVASLEFVEEHCKKNGLDFELIQEDSQISETPSPSELREHAYNSRPVVEWDGDMLTITQASTKWQYYAAEGSEKATQLQELIAAAKQTIRERFPDEEVE